MPEIQVTKMDDGKVKFQAKGEISLEEFCEKLGQFLEKEKFPSMCWPTVYFSRGKYISENKSSWRNKPKKEEPKFSQRDISKIAKSMTRNAIAPLRNDQCEFWKN